MKINTLQNTITSLFILITTTLFAQADVEGIVKDKNNQPLELANVLLKGTKYNTTTDANGKFIIDTRERLPFTLIVQYVGHQTAEVRFTTLPTSPIEIVLKSENQLNDVVITSRRRIEKAQNVPIPISVVGGRQAEQAGAFNVNRLKELVPSVQLYSSNPRNTTINIRGLGSTFGLTKD